MKTTDFLILKDSEGPIYFFDKNVDEEMIDTVLHGEREELDAKEMISVIKAYESIKDSERRNTIAYSHGYEFYNPVEDNRFLFEVELLDSATRISLAESEYDLSSIETTSERNGYPSNLKVALIDFENFDQAKEAAERFGLKLEVFTQKDGWQLWYRTGDEPYEELETTAEDYGDNYSFLTPDDKDDYLERIKEEIKYAEDFEAIQKITETAQQVFWGLEELEDGEVLVLDGINSFDTIRARGMKKYVDSETSVIGVIA